MVVLDIMKGNHSHFQHFYACNPVFILDSVNPSLCGAGAFSARRRPREYFIRAAPNGGSGALLASAYALAAPEQAQLETVTVEASADASARAGQAVCGWAAGARRAFRIAGAARYARYPISAHQLHPGADSKQPSEKCWRGAAQ